VWCGGVIILEMCVPWLAVIGYVWFNVCSEWLQVVGGWTGVVWRKYVFMCFSESGVFIE